MKKIVFYISILCVLLTVGGCGSIPEEDVINADTFITDQIANTEMSYEWKEISWYTAKKDVEKKLKNHTLFLDEGDMLSYTKNKTLGDGTPIKTKLSLGFTNDTEEGELAGVRWVFFLEENGDGKAEELYQSFYRQLESWGEVNTNNQVSDETSVMIKKDSGSYLEMRLMSSDTSSEPMFWSEYPETLWESFSEVVVFIWFPEERF